MLPIILRVKLMFKANVMVMIPMPVIRSSHSEKESGARQNDLDNKDVFRIIVLTREILFCIYRQISQLEKKESENVKNSYR